MTDMLKTDLAVLIAHLLEKPVAPSTLRDTLERLVAAPEAEEAILGYLSRLLDLQDDPEWLEVIAAYREGTILPEMADFLPMRDVLTGVTPEALTPFDLLQAVPLTADIDLLPEFPTFAERWAQEQPPAMPRWVKAIGFEWRFWREAGRLVMRTVADALPPSTPALAPMPVKGSTTPLELADLELVRRMSLSPDQVDDLDIEAVIWRNKDRQYDYTLVVSVQVPSRWPDLAGISVAARAGNWQAQGVTNADGEVTFHGLPDDALDALVVEVQVLGGPDATVDVP